MVTTTTPLYKKTPAKCKRKKRPPFYQRKKSGPVLIRMVLKRLVMRWHCEGIIPDSVVERMFKAISLREV